MKFKIRALIELAFFLFLFASFLWEAFGNFFCTESGRVIAVRHSLSIALVMTVWDSFACVCGLSVARFLRGSAEPRAATLWISAFVAAMGYFGAIFVLPPGQQFGLIDFHFDCSCFFTEGYGMMFPITWAPILVIGTTLREWLTQRMMTRTIRT